jgi:hypothetical protein
MYISIVVHFAAISMIETAPSTIDGKSNKSQPLQESAAAEFMEGDG